MSRSLGDALVHRYGVTPEADITARQLRPWDRILLLASDGIWTYLSNEEALQMAERNYHKRKAADTCNQLYREAARRWRLNSSRVDDITVVTVFLN
jgi:serine/threonine protein phosphatase PrpC